MTEMKAATTWWDAVLPYVRIARIDHWFKNAFMLLGVFLAVFYHPEVISWSSAGALLAATLLTCLVCSSNYVLNEYLDAERDRVHPTKKDRPAARGLIRGAVAIPLWLILAAIGIGGGLMINGPFAIYAAALWLMGCIYNIPPIRSKELAYVDVLSESVNNPLRLMLGWTPLVPQQIPPLSLILSYWLVGAFFMATKRFAELRHIGDPARAAQYRSSFRHYTEERLLVSMMFYITAAALFAGVFMVRYKLELLFSIPAVAGFFAYYLRLGLRPDSPVQNPEKLYLERGFMAYALLTVGVFSVLMFVQIPWLYEFMRVEPADVHNLWQLHR